METSVGNGNSLSNAGERLAFDSDDERDEEVLEEQQPDADLPEEELFEEPEDDVPLELGAHEFDTATDFEEPEDGAAAAEDDAGAANDAELKSWSDADYDESGVLRVSNAQSHARAAPAQGQADKVIAIAKGQVGYREGKNNFTKYAAELIHDKIAQRWWQNQPWCQTFQSWCFAQAGLKSLAPMTPGCATAVAWFRSHGRLSKYPAIGAQAFYGPRGGTHVGLVYKYDADSIWAVEGNTNDNGSSEGNGVYLKQHSRKGSYVFGYGCPRFNEPLVTADPSKQGKPGFTFMAAAVSGGGKTLASAEPADIEAPLPWVSWNQVLSAATHDPEAERAAKAGESNAEDDVELVQGALAKVLGEHSEDEPGFYGEHTEQLFGRFRSEKLKLAGEPQAAPTAKTLVALGKASGMFRARAGSMLQVEQKAAATAPGKISPKDVTFKRFTGQSTAANVAKWIRDACSKAGAVASEAWVRGFKTIVARESSGNPNACNIWDANAITPPGFHKVKDYGDGYSRHGISKLNGRLTHFQCSRGLVQCIPQTFANYHAPGTSLNIYDPVASIAASIRYVMARYKVAKNGSDLARKVQQADPNRPPKGY
jgi:hypothetical protein